ncbi:response regulator [Haloarcula sp. K1]|uniref:response regulator n=1 Tax=Haloarcula sp. K1 TaxID=1622207 RepID=UPI0007BC5CDC|nr:response regulator [Haloarcula sp. K1]KZX50140.1 hypothetical protein AV929_20360 [Haloarcula sp. K1]
MSDYTVWWIDDRDNREKNFANVLEEQADPLSVEFSNPEDATEALQSNNQPDADLVLIDWVLHQNGGYTGKGLTMAGTVRENLPQVPIYAFSGEAIDELQQPVSKSHFQWTCEVSDLVGVERATKLVNDLSDYEALESVRGEGFESLIETLNPPEAARQEVEAVIPREFNSGLKEDPTMKGGNKLAFMEWVCHRFRETPGPLWNKIWTATKLGLEVDVFDDYLEELYDTSYGEFTYDGIFSHWSGERWWSSEMIGAVVELNQDRDAPVGEICRTATKILDVPEDSIAYCRVCRDKYPETVAAQTEGKDARFPVHLICSNVHHSREGKFEDYRLVDEGAQ